MAVLGVGAGVLVSGGRSFAQLATNPRRIDVHHHFQPEAYVAFAKAHDRGGANNPWTLAKDLDDIDKNGTATAILSITSPGFGFGALGNNWGARRDISLTV